MLYFVFFLPGIAALFYAGWEYAVDSWRINEHSNVTADGPPVWQFKFMIPLAGALLLLQGAAEIARRSRGTPRIANRLLRRVRDYADVKGDGQITLDIAQRALAMLDVDPQGFDVMDRKLLEAVVQRFDGGPVGLDTIAANIGEEPDTIEDVIEPYLIQQGFLQRTPRGRVATLAAWRHLGLQPSGGASLFQE